ncbi:MAG TPA: hypothetical protein VHB49_25200 [Bradyrhizobium sp.]|nr:hypothetical protein [Bradyrhizobium sp.]
MIGITLTTDQIRSAPAPVRQWIEHEVIAALGIADGAGAVAAVTPPEQPPHLVDCSPEETAAVLAQIQGLLPAVNVFFELGRPGISYGRPPVTALSLVNILHHTRLQNIGQVLACLDAINQALAQVRGDPSAKFCGFDNEGHCFITQATQQNIAGLWHDVIASQQAPAAAAATAAPEPTPGIAPAA